MFYIVLICVAPVAIIAWIAVEFRAGSAVRIVFGVIALFAVGGAAYFLGGFGPSQELLFYQMSMGRVKRLVEHGDSSRVQQAFRQADQHHESRASYGGELWDALSRDIATDEVH